MAWQVLGKFASSSPKPVVYSGIGHAVDDDNILALKVGRPTPPHAMRETDKRHLTEGRNRLPRP